MKLEALKENRGKQKLLILGLQERLTSRCSHRDTRKYNHKTVGRLDWLFKENLIKETFFGVCKPGDAHGFA